MDFPPCFACYVAFTAASATFPASPAAPKPPTTLTTYATSSINAALESETITTPDDSRVRRRVTNCLGEAVGGSEGGGGQDDDAIALLQLPEYGGVGAVSVWQGGGSGVEGGQGGDEGLGGRVGCRGYLLEEIAG